MTRDDDKRGIRDWVPFLVVVGFVLAGMLLPQIGQPTPSQACAGGGGVRQVTETGLFSAPLAVCRDGATIPIQAWAWLP